MYNSERNTDSTAEKRVDTQIPAGEKQRLAIIVFKMKILEHKSVRYNALYTSLVVYYLRKSDGQLINQNERLCMYI